MRLACIFLLGIILFSVTPAYASDFKFSVAVVRQDDGSTLGEFWYADKVIWRLKICSDGVRPVSGMSGGKTTIITPDVLHGLFLLKIESQ